MKFYLQTLALILAMFGFAWMIVPGQPANAGLWEKFSSLGDETVQAKSFSIEAKGWDLRGYIFSPPGMNNICLFVAGSKKGGLTCW